mmetsp:Transcript_23456/g.37994  ORF Transcript_23456/g.37994 Transcript_23456/m.37994 type:complete len:80 (+) Transcript_23456:161-400(+)
MTVQLSKLLLKTLEAYKTVSGARQLTFLSLWCNECCSELFATPPLFGQKRAADTSNPRKISVCLWCERFAELEMGESSK